MIYLPAAKLTLRTPRLKSPRLRCANFYRPVNSLAPRKEISSNVGKRSSISRGPGKHWLNKPAVIYRGKREICNPVTDEGRAEYKWRTLLMWLRQDGWCCFHEHEFCPGRLKLRDATFEHEGKRTRGRQDDRISYFDAAGKEQPINGAAHGECNRIAGSRKLPIFHGFALFQIGECEAHQ